MEGLPADTLKLLSSFLPSHEAFNLSHTSSWWFQYVGDGSFWQRRLRSRDSWAKRLMVSPSLLFQGRRAANNLQLDSFAYLLDMEQQSESHFFRLANCSGSFCLDVRFALLPESDDYCFGGVIYGMQSAQRDSRPWPHYHLPVVVVNAVGDLYCSVLDGKPVVASNLQSSRWYHLMLSYDCNLQRQDVYLDGDNIHSATGTLHEEWEFMTHEQVGTGCVTGGEDAFPYRGHLGWYGFHGLVDEFRVWGRATDANDATTLAESGNLPRKQLQATMKLHEATWIRACDRWFFFSAIIGFATMATGVMPLENLPLDIAQHVCKFLTGFDGFNLSHVSTYWSSYFSDGSFWRERVGQTEHQQPRWSWKKQYVKARSMLLYGLKVNHRPDDLESFSYFVDDQLRTSRPHFMLAHMGVTSFSFDVWFSLLPATNERHFGGILLGLQSSSRESRQWPHYHQQFAMVSSKGELYCSVLSGKQVVANRLMANRWYHVALSYEHDSKQQKVYLNGKEISCMVGPRHHEWYHLTLAQVGTGCITSDTLHCPYEGHVGWYGFHGVVDAFRLWKGKLSQDDVDVLAAGGDISTIPLSAVARPHENTRMVKCTRPVEGKVLQFAK